MERYTGQWNQMRADLLGNENLARVGFSNRLDHCINLSPGTEAVSRKMMATSVQAILGAVYRDGGEKALANVMKRLDLLPLIKVNPDWSLSIYLDVVFGTHLLGRYLHMSGPEVLCPRDLTTSAVDTISNTKFCLGIIMYFYRVKLHPRNRAWLVQNI